MQFHLFRTMQASHPQETVRRMAADDYYDNMISLHLPYAKGELNQDFAVLQMISAERKWRQYHRPFYNVYPAVIKCLQNTKLLFSLSSIGFELPPTAICFPIGNEPTVEGKKVSSVLFEIEQTSEHSENPAFRMNINWLDGGECMVGAKNDEIIDTWDFRGNKPLVALCVGISMLARDDRYAEAILLANDSRKELSQEDHDRAVKRAINRGRNGLLIGKNIDISPHIRRPHFGIRWTGTNRSIPKLVSISGCLVSRSKLYPIPTGYLDKSEK